MMKAQTGLVAPSASVPGAATTVQIMVKDSKKYAATGGWGFGDFTNGKPGNAKLMQTCFACQRSRLRLHALRPLRHQGVWKDVYRIEKRGQNVTTSNEPKPKRSPL